VVCTAGVPPMTNRMLSQPPACPSLSGPIFAESIAHAASFVSVRNLTPRLQLANDVRIRQHHRPAPGLISM